MSNNKMREQFEAWFNKNITESLNTHNAALRGWQAALEHKPEVSQHVCDCPAKDMPFGRCCKAKIENLKELANDDQEMIEALDSECKALRQRVAELEKVLDGLPQDAIDGGWTAKGISQCLKNAEAENIRLQSECDKMKFAMKIAVKYADGVGDDSVELDQLRHFVSAIQEQSK